MSNYKEVSVVVTSCNRPDLLEKTLDSFNDFNTHPIKKFIVIDDSGETMNLKKPMEWVENQISFDLIQMVHSVYEQFEAEYSTSTIEQLIVNNDFIQNQLIELLQKEVNKKDFSIHVFGEKIEVFNDLIKEETFLSELSQLLLQLKTSSSSSEDSKVMDLVKKWSVEKVKYVLQHNQVFLKNNMYFIMIQS
jgi:hypothetical protein